ncbi:MAG: hypothetical protein JWQ11_3249 [Rhizobacter sp.]|nr:hypothetical protein [Rhizobacter sp.]
MTTHRQSRLGFLAESRRLAQSCAAVVIRTKVWMQISTTQPASGSQFHWLVLAGITAIAYLGVGVASLALSLPPGFASPLFPSAGIALVAVLMFGRRMTIGVIVGAFALNLFALADPATSHGSALPLASVIAAGAALQALFGCFLVRRFVGLPLLLDQTRQIASFFLITAAVGCLLNATMMTVALRAFGVLPAGAAFATWTTAWIGDTMGVLVGAPIVLTLIGRPASPWLARRLTVGLPLLLLTVLLMMAIAQIGRWDRDRDAASFDRDAEGAERSMQERLNESLHALEALRGLFIASDGVTQDEFRKAATAWLGMPIGIQALGWTQNVTPDQRATFEAQAQASGLGDFAVFDRLESGERVAPPPDRTVTAIRFIEPMARNRAALGVNGLSIPQARSAIEQTRRLGIPRATAGMRLAQESQQQVGVVVYRAVYSRDTELSDASRDAAFAGAVFVSLRMDDVLTAVTANLPKYLGLCLTEAAAPALPSAQPSTGSGDVRRRLGGPAGCESVAAPSPSRVKTLDFAGQHWELRVTADPAWVAGNRNWNAWLLSLVGLLGAAMMGALLLTVTGRARRIEQAVLERTAALQHEIAEREQTAAALRESEQRFRNIFNNVPIGVSYTDLHGRVMQSNPKFCQFTGYSPEELLGMTALDYTHPDDRAQDMELTAQLVSGEIPMFRRHERYLAKSGQVLWVQATVSLLRDAQGRPRRIVAVVEDITEHLRLLEAERARETAEAANKAKSDFLSRMSHELRTPLNAMLGFAQLLELDERNPLVPSQRQWAGQIQQAGWHLLEMINDVLDLSRIESGTLRLHLQTLDLPELLASSIALIQAAADRRSISITHDIADGTASMVGDMTRVKQILINLLSNAVKYNCDAGRVHIATRVSGPTSIDIAVTDTGIGMTGDQLANLFQPFNRLGREHTQTEGTGIGLMISQRLAELMGGSLRARSVAGEGSSFIVTLPVAPDADSVRSGLDELDASSPYYHRRLVHYIEDNETNVEVMRGILAQRPQTELGVSMTGLSGLQAVRRTLPSLVLLDLHLPDIDGFEVLRRLKEDPETADIVVVVVSADALLAQKEAALAAGAWSYMTKPITVSKMLGAIDELLIDQDTRFD